MSLTEIIKKERPNLKDISIKQYIKSLNKLKDLFETDNYEFLKEPNEVMEKLSNLHFTTIRNTLNAVIVYLLAVDGDEDIIKKLYQDLKDKNISEDQIRKKMQECNEKATTEVS